MIHAVHAGECHPATRKAMSVAAPHCAHVTCNRMNFVSHSPAMLFVRRSIWTEQGTSTSIRASIRPSLAIGWLAGLISKLLRNVNNRLPINTVSHP
jgi:hypothetical protein